MRLNKAEYEVKGLPLVLDRVDLLSIFISYDNGDYEWEVNPGNIDEVWKLAGEMHQCFYGCPGTKLDLNTIYQIITAFIN